MNSNPVGVEKKPCPISENAVHSPASKEENTVGALESIAPMIEIRAPEKLESQEQQLAYENFINVLSAILVKYAAEVGK